MKKENLFYLITILTILVIRISIAIIPEVDIKLYNFIIHHFWFGVILIFIGVLFSKQKVYPKIWLCGIGAGLIIDQFVFMVLGAGQDKEYWAIPSLLGVIIIASVIFPFRQKITNFFLKLK